jgi:hypothetical protein
MLWGDSDRAAMGIAETDGAQQHSSVRTIALGSQSEQQIAG